MSTPVTVSGVTYNVPLYGETGWAQGQGNLSQLLIALAAVTASTPAFIQTVSISTTPQTGVTGKTYLATTTSNAITLNLPTPGASVWLMVKDVVGNFEINSVTLHRHGSELIDGVASDKVLSIPNELCLIVSDGTNWFVLLEI